MSKEEMERFLELLTKFFTIYFTKEDVGLWALIEEIEDRVSNWEKDHPEDIEKVSIETFNSFLIEFSSGGFPHQRLGQAFMNKYTKDISCPEIFYGENYAEVYLRILEKFVIRESDNL